MYLPKGCIFACLASAHQQSQTYFNTWNGETWETWMGQRLFHCLKWRMVEKCGQDKDYSHICNGETWENVDREKNYSQRYPIMCPIRGQPLLGRSLRLFGVSTWQSRGRDCTEMTRHDEDLPTSARQQRFRHKSATHTYWRGNVQHYEYLQYTVQVFIGKVSQQAQDALEIPTQHPPIRKSGPQIFHRQFHPAKTCNQRNPWGEEGSKTSCWRWQLTININTTQLTSYIIPNVSTQRQQLKNWKLQHSPFWSNCAILVEWIA